MPIPHQTSPLCPQGSGATTQASEGNQARRNNKQALAYFKTELEYWQSDAARHNNAISIANHNVAKLQLQIRELEND